MQSTCSVEACGQGTSNGRKYSPVQRSPPTTLSHTEPPLWDWRSFCASRQQLLSGQQLSLGGHGICSPCVRFGVARCRPGPLCMASVGRQLGLMSAGLKSPAQAWEGSSELPACPFSRGGGGGPPGDKRIVGKGWVSIIQGWWCFEILKAGHGTKRDQSPVSATPRLPLCEKWWSPGTRTVMFVPDTPVTYRRTLRGPWVPGYQQER